MERGGGGGTVLAPFSTLDEAMHLLDGGTWPTTIQIEAQLAGQVDTDRLREAALVAADRHPMARARAVPSPPTDRQLWWEIPDAAEVDPLRVEVAAVDQGTCRERALSARVEMGSSPRFRLHVLPGRAPAEGDRLLLVVDHAASDGVGSLRLLRSILRAYAGEPDPVPPVDPVGSRTRIGADESVVRRLASGTQLADLVRRAVEPSTPIAPEGGDGRERGRYRIRLLDVDTPALSRAREHAAARGVTATVNDLLLAAVHLAVADRAAAHGQRPGRIAVLMPVNLRPPAVRHELVGNHASMVPVDTQPDDRTGADAVLATTARATERVKRLGLQGMLDLLELPGGLPGGVKRGLPLLAQLYGRRFGGTAVLSNLGLAPDGPSAWHAGDAGQVTGLWFSPPAQSPIALGVGAVSLGERATLTVRACGDVLGEEALGRFCASLGEALAALGAPDALSEPPSHAPSAAPS